MLSQSGIAEFQLDYHLLDDQAIDLGFEVGDAFELSTQATVDIGASVEGGFEWIIDLDGPTGTEGLTMMIDNAHLAGRAWLDVDDFEVNGRLAFLGVRIGGDIGDDNNSGLHLVGEATIALDRDGNLATTDDQAFTLSELFSGALSDALFFDFQGVGEAVLEGIEITPELPGLDTGALEAMELSITVPDLTDWSQIEVLDQGEFDIETPAGLQLFDARKAELLALGRVVIVLPNFGDLFNFKDMSFADIIAAIQVGVQWFDSALAGTSFYNTEIPVVNRSVADVLTFIDDTLERVEEALDNPAGAIQEVEDIIEDALGIEDNNTLDWNQQKFSLYLDGETLLLHIEFDQVLEDVLSFGLDSGAFGVNLGPISELVDVGIDLNFGVFVDAVLEIGVDFSNGVDDLQFFIAAYDEHDPGTSSDDTGTRIQLGAKAIATDMDLSFEPMGWGVQNGVVYIGSWCGVGAPDPALAGAVLPAGADEGDFRYVLDQDGDPDNRLDYLKFTFYLEDVADGVDDGRIALTDLSLANLGYEIEGEFCVNLPISLPFGTQDLVIELGNAQDGTPYTLTDLFGVLSGNSEVLESLGLEELTIADIIAPIEFNIGNFFDGFNIFSILNDPSFIIDGVDMVLGSLQDLFGNSVAVDLPLIGDRLGQAAIFISEIRTGFLAELREAIGGPGGVVGFLRDAIYNAFGPDGIDILLPLDGNGEATEDDIEIRWIEAWADDAAVEDVEVSDWEEGGAVPLFGDGEDELPDAIEFNMRLGGTAFGGGVDIPLEIDLPGFGLDVDGGFAVKLDWSFDFGFGLSLEDGFYLTTNDMSDTPLDPEIEVELGAFLDGEPLDNTQVTPFAAEGRLLFFKLTVEDMDRDVSSAGFQPSGVFGFLEVDFKGEADTGRLTLNHVFSAPITQVFDFNMGIDATLNFDMILEIDGVEGLPRLRTDFVLDWGWSLEDGLGSPEIGFRNLRLDVGSFVTDVLKPITDTIAEILDPFAPIVDVLLTEIPGLDRIIDDPTLLGLINLIADFMGKPQVNPAFFHAVQNMISIVQEVNAMVGMDGEIMLGSIIGLGTDTLSASQVDDDPPNFLADFLANAESSSQGNTEISDFSSGGGTSTPRSGFQILPYLTDISNWMQLISGGDAILFSYEMPYLEFAFDFRQQIATLVFGPAVINVSVIGGFSITGVRPNSPPQITRVSLRSPRRLRSCTNA